MKALRLFCPAEDHTWSQSIQTERELQICKDIASRLGLAIRLDEANGKLFLGRGKPSGPPEKSGRRINAAGMALIKDSEGCSLEAYKDPVGVWTIGYGHTGSDVAPGLIISQGRADQLLQEDLAKFEAGVSDLVKVPISDNQFAALVSFAYNLGLAALADSTLLRKLNAGDYQGAAEEFPRWVNAGGQRLPGLVTRRERERRLFAPPGLGAPINVSVASKVRPLAQQKADTCGLASAAMAINCLTGLNYTDLSLRERYDYRLLEALNGECPKHRWESPDFTPASWALIEQSLQAGRPVLFAANGPDFSASGRGHILLIVALKGDQVQMADPNGGVFRWWTRKQCELAPPHPHGKWLMVASTK